MTDLILEISNKYDKKIAKLQRDIERLQANKIKQISILQEDIGDQEESQAKEIIAEQDIAEDSQPQIEGENTTRTRLILAVNRMPLTGFGTAELLQSVNNDGNSRQVNKNRALKLFNDLINAGIVEVVKPRYGKQGGVYKKVAKKSQAESSQTIIEDNRMA